MINGDCPTLQGLILSWRNFKSQQLSPKKCVEFSWFFVVCILLIILLRRTNFRSLKPPKVKILWYWFCFKTTFAHRFEGFICTNKLARFFSQKNVKRKLAKNFLDWMFLFFYSVVNSNLLSNRTSVKNYEFTNLLLNISMISCQGNLSTFDSVLPKKLHAS